MEADAVVEEQKQRFSLENCWDVTKNDDKDWTTIPDNVIKFSGQFYPDL
jgi:hypothetical protein